jgi:hypothetical protein
MHVGPSPTHDGTTPGDLIVMVAPVVRGFIVAAIELWSNEKTTGEPPRRPLTFGGWFYGLVTVAVGSLVGLFVGDTTMTDDNISDRHRATHLGYLEYHQTVMDDKLTEVNKELDVIRKKNSGEEQYKKERDALLEFRTEVSKRLERSIEQLEGVMQHESDETCERAKTQKESSYAVHQEDEKEELRHGEGFTTASSLVEDDG